MFGEKNTLHSSLRIGILKKHDGGSIMLGPVLLHLGLDSLSSLMEQ